MQQLASNHEITIKLRGIAQFKELLGGLSTLTVADGTTVQEMLSILAEHLGAVFGAIVAESSSCLVYPTLRVVVNGRDVSFSRRKEFVLTDGDEVLFLSPLGGG
jgi:molybdopterin converting factor small subunit